MTRPTVAALVLAAALASAGAVSAETLVVCTEASPDFMNPQFSTANTAFDAGAQVYDRLVETEPGGANLIPALAESWDISPDGLVYTFHLRKRVKWHSHKSLPTTRAINADEPDFPFRRRAWPEHGAKKAGLDDRVAKVDALVFAIPADPAVRYAKLQAGECDIAR